MGVDAAGTAAVSRTLARELGWGLLDASEPHALHAIVARVLGRREHLVVTSAPLTVDVQQAVRGDLHGLRFVDLADYRGQPDDSVRTIRRAFGL